jgi:hypothetical protein
MGSCGTCLNDCEDVLILMFAVRHFSISFFLRRCLYFLHSSPFQSPFSFSFTPVSFPFHSLSLLVVVPQSRARLHLPWLSPCTPFLQRSDPGVRALVPPHLPLRLRLDHGRRHGPPRRRGRPLETQMLFLQGHWRAPRRVHSVRSRQVRLSWGLCFDIPSTVIYIRCVRAVANVRFLCLLSCRCKISFHPLCLIENNLPLIRQPVTNPDAMCLFSLCQRHHAVFVESGIPDAQLSGT